MKKCARTLATILLCLTLGASTAMAHSGRTDSSGGHRDNQNTSGLGSYHYHHGYSAHLHPNGVCPYSQPVAAKPVVPKNTTTATNISASINGTIIPSLNYENHTYVVAEDLNSYGFDVTWDGDARMLQIKRNATKEITPVTSSAADKIHTILTTDIEAYIYQDETEVYHLMSSYNIDGKTIVQFSDIGDTTWDSASRCSSIDF